ncbi:LGFP repeat-containing protein [Streptomyces pseudogriseolus]|uniref:LGFP repeat-containing protein n=1 Tax=Streptomyces pseudogriseolus TaxID=36817 RepID=UPI001CE2D894|nr:hypothetical protein [Streptomyces pseudogriseolus]
MTAIDDKWNTVQWIGPPFDAGAGSHEGPNPDRRGISRDYTNGSIYWSPATGAHEVHGAIRDAWAGIGWENSFLRYPTTDEIGTGSSRSNRFQHGHISWSPTEGAVAHRSTPID